MFQGKLAIRYERRTPTTLRRARYVERAFARSALDRRDVPLRFYGIEGGTRMSICQLSDDSLWLHSPLKLNEELKGELDWLGAVRFVVSPNKLHHLFIGDYFAAYPETRIYAPPGLPEKRPELPFHSVLGYAPEPGWAEDLGQMVFRGYRYMEEVGGFPPPAEPYSDLGRPAPNCPLGQPTVDSPRRPFVRDLREAQGTPGHKIHVPQ